MANSRGLADPASCPYNARVILEGQFPRNHHAVGRSVMRDGPWWVTDHMREGEEESGAPQGQHQGSQELPGHSCMVDTSRREQVTDPWPQ